MARLFVAVWPPAAVADRLRDLTGGDRPGVRWVSADNWHVTLRFLGDADPAAVASHLDGVHLPTAVAVLGPSLRRMARRLLVVPVTGLDALAGVVGEATAGLGTAGRRRRFTGHLTVARLRDGFRPGVLGERVDGRFVVHEVALVRSDLDARGATYTTIGRWPTT